MQLTTDELLTIHTQLSDKEMQIARLQNEVKRLTEENERLRQNALQQQVTMQGGPQFIILKLAKDSNSKLGKIKTATQGQFSVSDRDSNTPYIKNIRVVTNVVYYLKD